MSVTLTKSPAGVRSQDFLNKGMKKQTLWSFRHRFRFSPKGRKITNMKFWGKDTFQLGVPGFQTLWGFRRSQNGYERFPQLSFRKKLSGHLAKDQVWLGGGFTVKRVWLRGVQSHPPPPESFGLSDPRHRIDEQFQFHILFNFATTLS